MELEDRVIADEARQWWWVFLVIGIIWLLIGFTVLRLDLRSVATVGFLIGGMFLVSTMNEAMLASTAHGTWKYLHYAMAVIFLLGAVWSFINPAESFFALASVLGFVLVFMGTLEIMQAVASRGDNPMWGLGLAVGILMILLAVWVSQRYFPARAELLLVWVGFMSIFRGVGHLSLAFAVRRMGGAVATGEMAAA